jgi:hypothetical protein
MNLAKAFRTALLTAVVAGAAVLGTQAAQADEATGTPVPPSGIVQVTTPEDGGVQQQNAAPTPSPTATNHGNDPWD